MPNKRIQQSSATLKILFNSKLKVASSHCTESMTVQKQTGIIKCQARFESLPKTTRTTTIIMKYKNFLANFAIAKLLDPNNYATFLFCYYKTAAQFLTIFLVESVIFLFFTVIFA